MAGAANQDRVTFLAPLIRGAFGALAHVIAGMDAAEVQASLQRMAADPAEVLVWENAGPSAWQVYDAGGPLGAERIELAVATSLSGVTVERLLTMLGKLGDGNGSARLVATPEPWRILVRAPGLPRATVETCPTLDAPEDLVIRIVLGANGPANRLFKPGWLKGLWKRRTAQALQAWLAVNQSRPLVEHPAYAELVVPPATGMPGVYLVRPPPLPYSPLLPVTAYCNPVAWAVAETAEELEGCRAYYRQPGASFFAEPPLFRNRPPCSTQPAQLAGAIGSNRIQAVQAPWTGAGVVSVYTLPDSTLQGCPELRQDAYRGRYLIHVAETADEALTAWRKAGIKVPASVQPASVH